MRLRLPLGAKILLWFGLNLAVLALGVLIVVRAQIQFGLGALLMTLAGDRIQAVSELLVSELAVAPRADWDASLERFRSAHGIDFALLRQDAELLAGVSEPLPPEVRSKVLQRRGPPFGPGRGFGPPARRGPEAGPDPVADGNRRPQARRPPAPGSGVPGIYPKVMVRTANPTRYWVLVHVFLPDVDGVRPAPATLVLASSSVRFGGLLLDLTPWLSTAAAGLALSVLVWLPLVRGITRSISQMTSATGQITEGRFGVRVPDTRGDELGTLARSINQLAAQLAGFVTGQKRFLGDIAHELCSPLARIQMLAGILEERADAASQPYVADLREEVQQMSGLVNELLAFSKAGLRGKDLPLQTVPLAPLVERAAAREGAGANVSREIPPDLAVRADPELLARAVANLVRNAVRYAGAAGAITLRAHRLGDRVSLRIADSGPGVPADALEHLGTPFYRPDAARRRETGGAGLGLAIVRTCVEACEGTVTCRNLEPRGFEVELALKGAG